MVGGAGDPNHGATGRVLVFSLAMSLFHEIFLPPAFTGFLLPKLVFCPKTALCVSRSGEVGLSRPGEILGRETPLWAAQVGGFHSDKFFEFLAWAREQRRELGQPKISLLGG